MNNKEFKNRFDTLHEKTRLLRELHSVLYEDIYDAHPKENLTKEEKKRCMELYIRLMEMKVSSDYFRDYCKMGITTFRKKMGLSELSASGKKYERKGR